MANSYTVSIDVDAPTDVAWAVVGAPCGVTRWYSAYVRCEVEGTRRILYRADGAEVVEELRDRDDAARHYSYGVVSGVPVHEHHASFEVVERPGGCTVVWTTSGRPEDPDGDLEDRLADRQRAALGQLRAVIEQDARGEG